VIDCRENKHDVLTLLAGPDGSAFQIFGIKYHNIQTFTRHRNVSLLSWPTRRWIKLIRTVSLDII